MAAEAASMTMPVATNGNKKATIVVFSGELDKAYAAFIIASGAATAGMDVTLFFTFWGLNLLKKGGLEKAPLSKMNMGGLGKAMMMRMMRKANVMPLTQLLKDLRELGVKIMPCDMTMDVMGIKREDLIDDIDDIAGVGTYIKEAKNSHLTLFV
jgi:peroxiredoxin family protein